MKVKKVLISLFPAIIMIVLWILQILLKDSFLALRGVIMIEIVLIYPVVFFLQGLFTKLGNMGEILPLIISIISYLIYLVVIGMQKTAFIYIVFYFAWYTAGDSLGFIIKNK